MRKNGYPVVLVGLLLAALLLTAAAALAQGDEITLVPFENPMFGLQGLVPEGWTDAAPGVSQRLAAPGDLTSLIQQAAPGVTPDQLAAGLLPRLGLDALPEPAATLETPAFNWTIYHIDVAVGSTSLRVFLALTETASGTALVLFQTPEADADALADAVFMPAVEALAPLVEAAPTGYETETVTFDNPQAEGVTLAGTLSLPPAAGPYPAVILISGSGPSDRDESLAPLAAIKPFALIADYLTRQGIAVLRYDDRGTGESTGVYEAATSADLATDAEAALAYLQTRADIIPDQIGLLGHSEGGFIAPMVAARTPGVAFVISLSGNVVPGYDVMIRQNERIMAAAGIPEDQITARVVWVKQLLDAVVAEDWAQAEALLRADYEAAIEDYSAEQRAALGDIETYIAAQLASFEGWMRYFIMHDPAQDWQQVTVPVLAFFGGLDTQVDQEQNAPVLEAVLAEAGNDDVTIVTIPEANHLFQPAITGGLEEYGTLPQEFVPDLLPTITEWLAARVTLAE